MVLAVSPLLSIRNNSGLPLDLKFRRPLQPRPGGGGGSDGGEAPPPAGGGEAASAASEGEGTLMTLADGDVFDDAMVSFESLDLTGEQRRIVSGLGIGNYTLAIRPSPRALPSRDGQVSLQEPPVQWSEDVAGARLVRVSRWIEDLQRGFQRTMGDLFGRSFSSSFGSLLCKYDDSTASSLASQDRAEAA
eukprot:jgi/Mesen1/6957/ME000360S06225